MYCTDSTQANSTHNIHSHGHLIDLNDWMGVGVFECEQVVCFSFYENIEKEREKEKEQKKHSSREMACAGLLHARRQIYTKLMLRWAHRTTHTGRSRSHTWILFYFSCSYQNLLFSLFFPLVICILCYFCVEFRSHISFYEFAKITGSLCFFFFLFIKFGPNARIEHKYEGFSCFTYSLTFLLRAVRCMPSAIPWRRWSLITLPISSLCENRLGAS